MTKHRIGNIIALYGAFLIAAGITGYLLTKETSTSSLMNGVVFGSLMMVLGILSRQGRPWTLPASVSATGIFALTFLWRGGVQWMDVSNGLSEHLSVGVLLTLMFGVSLYVLTVLVRELRR